MLEYRAYFGHSYYSKKFKLLDTLEKLKTADAGATTDALSGELCHDHPAASGVT